MYTDYKGMLLRTIPKPTISSPGALNWASGSRDAGIWEGFEKQRLKVEGVKLTSRD